MTRITSTIQARAEIAIATILAELEHDTGCSVQNLEIKSIEVTQMQDERPRFMRFVHITLNEKPGCGWANIALQRVGGPT